MCPYCSRLYILNQNASRSPPIPATESCIVASPEAQDSIAIGAEIPPEVAPGECCILILIDGSGFIFRAFHALPPMNAAGWNAGECRVRLHQYAGAS